MKVRAYLSRVIGATDALSEFLKTTEPAGLDWVSIHRPLNGGLVALVFVRGDELVLDFAALGARPGVKALPTTALDVRYADVPQAKRNAIERDIKAESDGATDVDAGALVDWEDALCEMLRRNGETGRRRLRSNATQRTRQWMDEHA